MSTKEFEVVFVIAASAILFIPNKGHSQDSSTVPAHWLAVLQSRDPSEREEMAKEINTNTPKDVAVPILVKLIDDSDRAVRLAAIDSLGDLGERSAVALPSLVKCVNDSDNAIRKACITSIGKIGINDRHVIPKVIAAVKDRNPEVRLAAVKAISLARADSELEVNGLVSALSDVEVEVRLAAVGSLASVPQGTDRTVMALARMLSDDSSLVRAAAANALQKIDADIDSAIPDLSRAIDDTDSAVRIASVLALKNSNGGISATNAIAKALKSSDWRVRRAAIQTIGTLEQDSVSVSTSLVPGLSDEADSVRESAAESSAKVAHPDDALVRALASRLRDRDADVRYYAAKALGAAYGRWLSRLEDPDFAIPEDDTKTQKDQTDLSAAIPSAANTLTRWLNDKDQFVRAEAAKAIVPIIRGTTPLEDTEQERRVIELGKLVFDSDSIAARGAEQALVTLCESRDKSTNNLWPSIKESLLDSIGNKLIDLSSSRDNNVRYMTISLLGELPVKGAQLQIVVKSLRDSDPAVRLAAAKAIGDLDIPVHRIGLLAGSEEFDMLADSEKAVRPNGLEALREMPETTRAISSLVEESKSDDSQIRISAIKGLSRELPKIDSISGYLQNGSIEDDPEGQALAVTALQSLGPLLSDGQAVITSNLSVPDADVQVAAILAFKEVTPNEYATNKIIELLRAKDPRVRESAASTLGKAVNASPQGRSALVDTFERDTSAAVRIASLKSLIDLGDTSEEFNKALAQGMSDDSEDVKSTAIQELGLRRIHDPLIAGLNSGDVAIRQHCADALTLEDKDTNADTDSLPDLAGRSNWKTWSGLARVQICKPHEVAIVVLVGKTV